MADDPNARPSCMEVLHHPFIAAVDSNMDAHREMGDLVRRRMRDLAKLRRLHGLRYAMHAHRPEGTDDKAFLEVLDRRRLRLKNREASAGAGHAGNGFVRQPTSTTTSVDGTATPLARNSLNAAYKATDAQQANGRESSHDGSSRVHLNCSYGTGAENGGGMSKVDKMALLSALPDLERSTTMPARRFREAPEGLSPVPSCDPSMYTGDNAALPGAWSAYPLGYEALQHRDALMEGLAPGAAHAVEGARARAAAAGPGSAGGLGAGRASREPPAALPTPLEDPKEGQDLAPTTQ
ncbi:hypothetical protein HYH03_005817 [Edaphochlamys debaryana]|uniref:Uncharacterized protein n=1 Tax=Edaphochlamys debaryana TaxID=47281 RepID=A0A835YEN8_9CHLO|nr:hypothetical protein HYH03_005817 [Edaphochlamys debaryana]|eukprot:KAG2496219.1 hypothetical protein HYH03_005817 [Edaphochlamys debaryana]